MFKRIILPLIFFFLSLQTQAMGVCFEKDGFKRCDLDIYSSALNHNEVPLFWYMSEAIDFKKEVQFALFLHGRGFARHCEANDSMLEHVGVKDLFEQVGPQVILVAPQDIFIHDDSNSFGQDYWIGKEGRDWSSFLGEELPRFVDVLSASLEISKYRFDMALGISMGAHGAMMMGQNYPEQFKKIAALSPIFKTVSSEIPEGDFDVFMKKSTLVEENNIGAIVRANQFLKNEKSYFSISEADFGRNGEKYPKAQIVWHELSLMRDRNTIVDISDDNLGHSMNYWRLHLPKAINFLSR